MITRDDFIKALGEPDQSFVDRVYATLAALPEKKEEKVKKTYKTVLLAAALLAIMTAALAEAGKLGIWNFLDDWEQQDERLKIAVTEATQHDIPLAGEPMALADVRLSEAIYDGISLMAVVDVQAREENVLLVNWWDCAGETMTILSADGRKIETDMPIEEYAEKNGYDRVLAVDAWLRPEAENCEQSERVCNVPGGVMKMYCFSGLTNGESLPATLQVNIFSYGEGEMTIAEQGEFRSEIPRGAAPAAELVSTAAADYPGCGVRVDSVRAYQTAIGPYVQVEWTVVDEAAYARTDDGLWFEFLDENGERIDDWFGGEVSMISAGRQAQKETLKYFGKDISSFTLRAYECWEKQRFETNVILMQKAN